RNGQDHYRLAAQEMTGFGIGTAAGAAAAKASFSAGVIAITKVGVALSWSPAGWVILAAAGITALGVGYYAANYGDTLGKRAAGAAYDASSNWQTRGRR
ncbi:hypothetical protein, partial [Alkalimonas sp.]|uniref:hypothetical protein n=1 Tax=Alkalimonas sp. TaxID=1872453 RepID=UPI00263A64F2